MFYTIVLFFFSSRRRHTRLQGDWSSDVCSSDLIFWILGWSADYAGGTMGRVLQFLSILEHNESFAKGVVDTKDILYYLNFTVLALFLTLRSLEARRWRG